MPSFEAEADKLRHIRAAVRLSVVRKFSTQRRTQLSAGLQSRSTATPACYFQFKWMGRTPLRPVLTECSVVTGWSPADTADRHESRLRRPTRPSHSSTHTLPPHHHPSGFVPVTRRRCRRDLDQRRSCPPLTRHGKPSPARNSKAPPCSCQTHKSRWLVRQSQPEALHYVTSLPQSGRLHGHPTLPLAFGAALAHPFQPSRILIQDGVRRPRWLHPSCHLGSTSLVYRDRPYLIPLPVLPPSPWPIVPPRFPTDPGLSQERTTSGSSTQVRFSAPYTGVWSLDKDSCLALPVRTLPNIPATTPRRIRRTAAHRKTSSSSSFSSTSFKYIGPTL